MQKINMPEVIPYLKILGITLLLTITSFIVEFQRNPSINSVGETKYTGVFVSRYIHYTMLFYFAVFLLFFKERGRDAIIYISFAILLSFSWILFDCCIASYHELLFYGANHHDYITSFHPCLYVIFDTYQWIPLTISGGMMFFTVFYLLWRNTTISLTLRLLAGGVFLCLYVYNLATTRVYDSKLKYPLEEEHRLYKYFTVAQTRRSRETKE
jgi:hypothetical protein